MKQTDNCSEEDKWKGREGGGGGGEYRGERKDWIQCPSSVAGSRGAALQQHRNHDYACGSRAVRLQVLRLWLAELKLRNLGD